MASTGYKLLGFTVWHGARWYLRRRVRPRRGLIVGALLGATTLVGAAALARRLSA
jgi:hypothetical protein